MMAARQYTLVISCGLMLAIVLVLNKSWTRDTIWHEKESHDRTLHDMNSALTTQDDPDLVDIVRRVFIQPPTASHIPYALKNPELKDFSRGQSAIIDKLFKNKRNGFFVECGAFDGEGRSNSLFFERELGWQGLLIEADPANYYELLKRNRKSHHVNACLSVVSYPTKMRFNQAHNMGRVFKGEEEEKWAKSTNLKINTIQMQCFPLYTLMKAMGRTSIDFFSLDVEGSEMDVLKTIPFDKLDIKSITVEFIHGGPESKQHLQTFFEDKGYIKIGEVIDKSNLANDMLFAKSDLVEGDD
ncbi:protein Star-like [Amphiura filiformis]|uniref:protein Star-like n=1 Tax=Amphiura filiformis TaxID=82378 RepID=UPI003B20BDF2